MVLEALHGGGVVRHHPHAPRYPGNVTDKVNLLVGKVRDKPIDLPAGGGLGSDGSQDLREVVKTTL